MVWAWAKAADHLVGVFVDLFESVNCLYRFGGGVEDNVIRYLLEVVASSCVALP